MTTYYVKIDLAPTTFGLSYPALDSNVYQSFSGIDYLVLLDFRLQQDFSGRWIFLPYVLLGDSTTSVPQGYTNPAVSGVDNITYFGFYGNIVDVTTDESRVVQADNVQLEVVYDWDFTTDPTIPAYVWSQVEVPLPNLFTKLSDRVNFNNLDADQSAAIKASNDWYNALQGADHVTLPDTRTIAMIIFWDRKAQITCMAAVARMTSLAAPTRTP